MISWNPPTQSNFKSMTDLAPEIGENVPSELGFSNTTPRPLVAGMQKVTPTRGHPLARCTESFAPIASPRATRSTSERVDFQIKICRLLRTGSRYRKALGMEGKLSFGSMSGVNFGGIGRSSRAGRGTKGKSGTGGKSSVEARLFDHHSETPGGRNFKNETKSGPFLGKMQ